MKKTRRKKLPVTRKSILSQLFAKFCISWTSIAVLLCCPFFITDSGADNGQYPLLSRTDECISEKMQPNDTPQSTPLKEMGTLRPIYLKSRTLKPKKENLITSGRLKELVKPEQKRLHVLVQLDLIPDRIARNMLKVQGIDLLCYIPEHAWIASIPADNPSAALSAPGMVWAGELNVNDKLDPAIVNNQWGEWSLSEDGTAAVCIALHKDEPLPQGRELVKAYSGKVVGEVVGIHMIMAELPKENVRRLATEEAVQWIEPAGPPLTGANDGIRYQINVDELQQAPYSLDGTAIDVLIYDTGQVGDHTDFGGRLVKRDTDWQSEHATLVAGVIGGDGSNSFNMGGTVNQWKGMAPNVDLISYIAEYSGTGMNFYENVPDIEHDFAEAQNLYGADVANMSLSSNIYLSYSSQCDKMGNYGSSAVLIDQIVRGGNSAVGSGDKYITVLSVGNERGWPTSCGDYATISPPAAAKNPIIVGGANTDLFGGFYSHSSWGPTDDGRIKPTVISGACQTNGDMGITSTDNYPVNDYTTGCGTSYASASVTGGVALMLQQYRTVYNTSGKFWPSTAKALLIQSASDSYPTGPDYRSGFGLVNIQAAVDLITKKAFRQSSISHGQVHTYYFRSTDSEGPFTVSLAWDDYEATFNASPALVNNLNLEAEAPDGTIWLPWVLNPAEPESAAYRSTDSKNNQEQVRVYAAYEDLTGIWTIRVRGISVTQGPQDYSLVCNDRILNEPPAINPALPLLLLSYLNVD